MLRAVCRLLAITALFSLPSTAFAWWNDDWTFRKEITLDLSATGADIKGAAADVPVLVRLSLANFEFWADAKPDGSDVRFVLGDDKTPLKFHVERWDATNQMAYLWVQVPRLTGGASTDKVFMYYGNPNAPSGSEPGATYDKNTVLAYHFAEESGGPKDATAYGTNPSASTAEHMPASLIGGGASIGPGKTISVPVSAAIWQPSGAMTLSSWVRVYQAQSDAYLAAIEGDGQTIGFGLRGLQPFLRVTGGAAPVDVTATGPGLTSGTWHHVAMTLGDGSARLFLDGVEVGTALATIKPAAGTLTIGGTAAGSNALLGEIDEFQMSAVVRSAEWLQAAARGQGPDATLVVYGADAQKEGSGPGYLSIIAKNLTVDAWVVIAICSVMLVYSLALMLLKALHLGRVEKANAAFLKAYHDLGVSSAADRAKAAGALASLDTKSDVYGASTLYSLYHAGVAELNKRIGGQTVSAARAAVVGAQSVEAIRATLDASITRITQKLQSQMVLLTIAISGGPFLGLLGTVIGVMIVFAAVAAAGDVNINAIAPGVAAALAATVAGLGVAIPCLFGYNWLNTRIKAITADNRVFVDEFVARMAEEYA
jgi:biopolymer transport protein ExbB